MFSDKRQKLGRMQLGVALALRAVAPAPKGFDPAKLAVAVAALKSKRIHAAGRAWPALARKLDESFDPLFHEYAADNPTPAAPREDAIAFAKFLVSRGKLPQGLKRFLWLERLRSVLHGRNRHISTLHSGGSATVLSRSSSRFAKTA